MRPVYALQFQVRPSGSETIDELLSHIESEVRGWISGKYNYAWNTDLSVDFTDDHAEPLPGHSIESRRLEIDGARLLDVSWNHPDETDDSLSWHTDIVLAADDSALEVSFLIRLKSRRFVVKPPSSYEVGRPRVVSNILNNYRCQVHGSPVPVRTTVVDRQGMDGFIDHLEAPPSNFSSRHSHSRQRD